MLRLPSGQRVGILSERARQHAAARGLHVFDDTPLEALHPLVDVIFYPEGGDTVPHKSFVFSGHTLADRAWLACWPEADRNAFLDWLEQVPQRQEIARARLRLTCRALPARTHRSDYPARLYSVLERRLQGVAMERATAGQWRQTLANLQRDGIRAEELTWSGLPHFLQHAGELNKTVTRQELLERIDFTAIRLEIHNEMERRGGCGLGFNDIVRRLSSEEVAVAGLPLAPEEHAVLRQVEPVRGYRIGTVWRGGRVQPRRWFLLGPDGRAVVADDGEVFHAQRELAEAAANRHACHMCTSRGELAWAGTYDYLSLHGGEEYREWLVTLPDYPGSFFGSHYYDRNVLLHIRTKLRTDVQGRRLLFIEELQSDWHQAARRFGYDNRWDGQIAVAPFRKEWVGLGLKLMLMHAVERGCDAVAWAAGELQQLRYGGDITPVQRLYDREIPRVLQQLGRRWQAAVDETRIETRRPWLQAVRVKQRWRVTDPDGRFRTQPRYTLAEAHRLITRHSKKTKLAVPMFEIPAAMAERIRMDGLPMFGETLES